MPDKSPPPKQTKVPTRASDQLVYMKYWANFVHRQAAAFLFKMITTVGRNKREHAFQIDKGALLRKLRLRCAMRQNTTEYIFWGEVSKSYDVFHMSLKNVEIALCFSYVSLVSLKVRGWGFSSQNTKDMKNMT